LRMPQPAGLNGALTKAYHTNGQDSK
jgi:hypothetical protein